jgi:prepilin-type N-terminal cleavage/methylation domain-containing protein
MFMMLWQNRAAKKPGNKARVMYECMNVWRTRSYDVSDFRIGKMLLLPLPHQRERVGEREQNDWGGNMKKSKGFTLVEMAVTLLIIGLLMGGLMMGLTAQVDQRRYNDSQKALEDIKDALIGYAIQHGHLPCPDRTAGGGATANDGAEDFVVATGVCATQAGNIPWATLGVSDLDAWGHRFHYAVTKAYSDRAPATVFTQSSVGILRVCQTTIAPAGTCPNPDVASALPAVVLSFGPNGKGAITSTGALIPSATGPNATPPATNSDEYVNFNANAITSVIFVSRPKSAVGGALGEFDDQVAWLSSPTLIAKMAAAGKAPLP